MEFRAPGPWGVVKQSLGGRGSQGRISATVLLVLLCELCVLLSVIILRYQKMSTTQRKEVSSSPIFRSWKSKLAWFWLWQATSLSMPSPDVSEHGGQCHSDSMGRRNHMVTQEARPFYENLNLHKPGGILGEMQ